MSFQQSNCLTVNSDPFYSFSLRYKVSSKPVQHVMNSSDQTLPFDQFSLLMSIIKVGTCQQFEGLTLSEQVSLLWALSLLWAILWAIKFDLNQSSIDVLIF